ncbi:low density lipoprotein receptor adapter protein 1 isoform X4 [Silurus meridionalis]|nr:low density lipoprotein receptor adapter protein 1 isoform X4 [Silurus meridionalis]
MENREARNESMFELPENWTDTKETLLEGMVFNVKYLGMTLVGQPKGEEMAATAIQRIVSTARASAKKFRKVTLTVSPKGIILTDTETSDLIENVSIYRHPCPGDPAGVDPTLACIPVAIAHGSALFFSAALVAVLIAYLFASPVIPSRVTSAKTAFYKEKLEASAQDPRKLHNIFSSLLDPPAAPAPSSLTANDFASFYDEKIKKICQTFTSSPTIITQHSQQSTTSLSSFSTLTEDEILQVIRSCNPTTCPLDPIPSTTLQTITQDLLPFISTIINRSLTSGYVPTTFKQARVIPILKKPALDPSDINNYRPVSLLSFLSKSLERTVFNQLSVYLSQNNLHDPNQSGFKAAHSTETALLAVSEKLHAARSAKLSSVLIFLDLSAAFDTVNHKTLLSTLKSLGICGTAWEWFASYLEGRSYQAAQVLVQSLVISRLDYCNSLLAGLPLNAIRPLQMIQKAAARLVFNQPKFSHTTPLLRFLHWLPVAARIRFKTLMLAYKAKNGPAPSYLSDLITSRTAPRCLRCSSTARLAQAVTLTVAQAFKVALDFWEIAQEEAEKPQALIEYRQQKPCLSSSICSPSPRSKPARRRPVKQDSWDIDDEGFNTLSSSDILT